MQKDAQSTGEPRVLAAATSLPSRPRLQLVNRLGVEHLRRPRPLARDSSDLLAGDERLEEVRRIGDGIAWQREAVHELAVAVADEQLGSGAHRCSGRHHSSGDCGEVHER
jgi:hypothetical protein